MNKKKSTKRSVDVSVDAHKLHNQLFQVLSKQNINSQKYPNFSNYCLVAHRKARQHAHLAAISVSTVASTLASIPLSFFAANSWAAFSNFGFIVLQCPHLTKDTQRQRDGWPRLTRRKRNEWYTNRKKSLLTKERKTWQARTFGKIALYRSCPCWVLKRLLPLWGLEKKCRIQNFLFQGIRYSSYCLVAHFRQICKPRKVIQTVRWDAWSGGKKRLGMIFL